jgi:hypothetical protein
VTRWLFAAAFGALAVFYYLFFGPGPGPDDLLEDRAWWEPRGWVLRWQTVGALADLARGGSTQQALAVLILSLPAVAATTLGLMTARGALGRALSFWTGLTLVVFCYYGLLAPRVWQFFDWRFTAVAASFTAIASAILFAPSLGRALAGLPRAAALGLAAILIATVFALCTEVTGTNADMPFNVSPWPVVTMFGLGLVGSWIAATHVAAGTGLWLRDRFASAGPRAGLLVASLGAAVGGAALSFWLFRAPDGGAIAVLTIAAAAYALVAAARHRGESGDGRWRLAIGVALLLLIGATDWSARRFQAVARDATARDVLLALDGYHQKHGTYPDDLEELVGQGLDDVPRPQIGFWLDDDDRFLYTNYGDSYSLEFASVQWVQCTYSPPFSYASLDDEEEYEAEEGEKEPWELDDVDVAAADPALTASLQEVGLPGAWNCPGEPPKLW